MNKMKTMLATGAAIAALLVSTTGVFAGAVADATVGDDGNSYSYTEDNDTFKVDNNNKKTDLENFDMGAGVSGLNFQMFGDDDNTISTGDAEGEAESDNFANSNMTAIEADDDMESANSEAEVGEDGDAEAYAYDNDKFIVEILNEVEADNVTVGLAVSGLNFQACNDDDNSIDTGDSDAMATTLNEVNSNWTSLGGSHSAYAMASVGDDGNAYAFAEDNDVVKVSNKNKADLDNYTIAAAVSGLNFQAHNDDDNEIETGAASATSEASNYVNNNITVVGGDGSGGATATATVGEDSETGCSSPTCGAGEEGATAYAYDNDNVTVENNNHADVTNVSAGVAVSGGNVQAVNDDGNSISTGSASGSSTSTNTVNSNWTSIGTGLGCGMPSCE